MFPAAQPIYMMAAASIAFDLSRLPQGWTPTPERLQSSLTDSEMSTEQTVRRMCDLVREGVSDPVVRSIADRLGRWGDGSARKICWDAFWFCKHHIRFATDENAVLALFAESDQVDFLMSPPVLLAMRRPAGDCDDFTMLCCALLESRGIAWEIVTIACDRSEPQRWSHVYCRAILPDGRRLSLDPTNGNYPGWEVPAYDVYRRQYWNDAGQPVDGPASIRDLRMHAYRARRRGMRGFGDIDISGLDPAGTGGGSGTGTIDPTTGLVISGSNSGLLLPSPGDTLSLPGASSSSFNWNNLFNNLSSVGGKLATIALTPKGGYVTTDSRGNVLVSNTGLPAATAGTGNLLFYLAIGVAVLLAVKAVSK